MFEDTDDYKKARSNLIMISSVVILYIFGDAKIDKGILFGGSITFGNENALPIAGVLMFIFLFWRFLLSAGDSIKEFRWDYWTLFYSCETLNE